MTDRPLPNGAHVALCLRELRSRLGITQKDLAKDMGTTRQTVSRWETGKEPLNVEQVEGLCMALKCTRDEFLGSNSDFQEMPNDSSNTAAEVRYGTFKVKMTSGTRKYPIGEQTRASILRQLRLLSAIRSNHNSRRWIHFATFNNKLALLNLRYILSVELIGDDVEAMPQYYRPEVYQALDDLDSNEVSETLQNECEIIIAEIGEEKAMRMVSCVRVTYENGEDEWNLLDNGCADTFFGLEAASFDIPQCTFAETEEEGYYRARYANLDHVAVMEVPSDRYHRLTRNRPSARRRRTMPLCGHFQPNASTG